MIYEFNFIETDVLDRLKLPWQLKWLFITARNLKKMSNLDWSVESFMLHLKDILFMFVLIVHMERCAAMRRRH